MAEHCQIVSVLRRAFRTVPSSTCRGFVSSPEKIELPHLRLKRGGGIAPDRPKTRQTYSMPSFTFPRRSFRCSGKRERSNEHDCENDPRFILFYQEISAISRPLLRWPPHLAGQSLRAGSVRSVRLLTSGMPLPACGRCFPARTPRGCRTG